MVNLRKPAKVNLTKGQNVCLTKTATKDGDKINYSFVGANWECMRNGQSVDLDSTILVYDSNKRLIDKVYFGNLESSDRAIRHSGDDREGDTNGNDGIDNEVISINFEKLNPKAEYLVSVLNNYTHQKFGDIPNIELRIYTNDSGRKTDVDNVIASYKLDNDKDFDSCQAIVLGHFYKHSGIWKFSADGIGTKERDINSIASGSALDAISD